MQIFNGPSNLKMYSLFQYLLYQTPYLITQRSIRRGKMTILFWLKTTILNIALIYVLLQQTLNVLRLDG